MSILNKESKKMLVESMRSHLGNILKESATLKAADATQKCKFLNESATYEQLLNITLNPHRREKYLPSYVLEGAVAVLHSACMTGRKYIGQNAIIEGSYKLAQKTGAVVTKSMMEAAYMMVTEGCGLEIVGDIIKKTGKVLKEDPGWDAILSKITDPAEKAKLQVAIANMKAGTTQNLGPEATSILSKNLKIDLDKAAKFAGKSGITPQEIGTRSTLDTISKRITDLQKLIADPATKAVDKSNANFELQRLISQRDSIAKTLAKGFSGGSKSGFKAVDPRAFNVTMDQLGRKAGGRMNPLLAAGLGAAALGGGMLAYKKYKDAQNAGMEG